MLLKVMQTQIANQNLHRQYPCSSDEILKAHTVQPPWAFQYHHHTVPHPFDKHQYPSPSPVENNPHHPALRISHPNPEGTPTCTNP